VNCFLKFNLVSQPGLTRIVRPMERTSRWLSSSNGVVESGSLASAVVSIDCAIFGFEQGELKVLLLNTRHPSGAEQWVLPADPLLPDEDLDQACYRIVKTATGLERFFVQQVGAFGKKNNHPSGRIVSAVHYALVNMRDPNLKLLENGLDWRSVAWEHLINPEHKTMLDTCLHALRTKIQQEPAVFGLLPEKFSLRELQQVFECILGTEFDRRNFRKKLFATRLLRDEQQMENQVRHRPGKLYSLDHTAYAQFNRQFFPGVFSHDIKF